MLNGARILWARIASENRARQASLALFALATAIRLYFNLAAHPPGKFINSDMWVHNHRAENILSGALGPWDSFTPVGYPALLALVFALAGKSYAAVGALQAILGGAMAPLTHFIAHRVSGSASVALAAGLLSLAYVPLIYYGGLLMTEVPFGFCLLATVALLVSVLSQFPAHQSPKRAGFQLVLAGLFFGVGCLIRPNLLLALPFLGLFALCAGVPKRSALLALGIFCASATPPIAAGSIHASRLVGKPTVIATNGGLNFYLAHAPVRGAHYKEGTFTHKIVPIPNMERYQTVYQSPVPLYDDKFFYARGLETLASDPSSIVAALENGLEGMGLGRLGYWPSGGGLGLALTCLSRLAFWALILPAALHLLALALLRRLRAPAEHGRLLLAAFIAGAFATFYGFLGDPRMRVPFDPLLGVLAIDGIARLRKALPALRQLDLQRAAPEPKPRAKARKPRAGGAPGDGAESKPEVAHA